VPDTITVEPGGPVAGNTRTPGITVNRAWLRAVPARVVTVMRPAADGMAGTVAVIFDADRTLYAAATPRNRTAVALVNPDPVIVTSAPAAPRAGLKEPIPGAVREDAVAGAATPKPAMASNAAAASSPRPAIG